MPLANAINNEILRLQTSGLQIKITPYGLYNIVCFRKDASITIEQMDEIINGYHYPSDFADRLHKEVSALLK